MSLIAYYQSTNELTATLTDDAGDPVTGATVTLTLVGPDGTDVLTDQSMSDDGGGEYSYTIADDTMTQKDAFYTAQVTAVSGSNQRYAEVGVHNRPDTD